jgi:RNA methyltransferase, TrmH family
LEIDKAELQKISLQQSPQEVLAVFEIPQYHFDNSVIAGKLSLALDNIQDPGNMGTILRLADWFGIEHVLCSKGTADAFNPKTVQATMGAIGRIKIHYLDLSEVLSQVKMPVYGTFLEGDPIYDVPLKREGIVVMGNEGNGISGEIAPYITQKLFIPDYPVGKTGSESLNVGVATAIVCSEFRRRNR